MIGWGAAIENRSTGPESVGVDSSQVLMSSQVSQQASKGCVGLQGRAVSTAESEWNDDDWLGHLGD